MNAYKVELLIINHEGLSEEGIKLELNNVTFPNDCLRPHVMTIDSRGIGEWADDHPLNRRDTMVKFYKDLFYEARSDYVE